MALFFYQKHTLSMLLMMLSLFFLQPLAAMPGTGTSQLEQDDSGQEQPTQQPAPQGAAAAPVTPPEEAPTPAQQVGADGGELSDKDLNGFAVGNHTITDLQKQAKSAISRMDEILDTATKTRDELQNSYFSVVDEINALPSLAALEAPLPPSP